MCECLEERKAIEGREDVKPSRFCEDYPGCYSVAPHFFGQALHDCAELSQVRVGWHVSKPCGAQSQLCRFGCFLRIQFCASCCAFCDNFSFFCRGEFDLNTIYYSVHYEIPYRRQLPLVMLPVRNLTRSLSVTAADVGK